MTAIVLCRCNFGCWYKVSVKVATASGKSGLAIIQISQSSLLNGYAATVDYTSYTSSGINRSAEELTTQPTPFEAVPDRVAMSVLGGQSDSVGLESFELPGGRVLSADQLPDISQDWTLSTKIIVRALSSLLACLIIESHCQSECTFSSCSLAFVLA